MFTVKSLLENEMQTFILLTTSHGIIKVLRKNILELSDKLMATLLKSPSLRFNYGE